MRSAARRRACEGRDAVGHDDASGGFFARGNDAEKTKVGGGGRERTSGEGGFMIVLHASGTDSLADRLRFSRAARPGWWARICSERRGSRCERRVQKRGRVGGGRNGAEGNGGAQQGTAASTRWSSAPISDRASLSATGGRWSKTSQRSAARARVARCGVTCAVVQFFKGRFPRRDSDDDSSSTGR
jgi:hypothetical protein